MYIDSDYLAVIVSNSDSVIDCDTERIRVTFWSLGTIVSAIMALPWRSRLHFFRETVMVSNCDDRYHELHFDSEFFSDLLTHLFIVVL